MLSIIEDIILILLVIWFVDHVVCKGKNTTRVWIIIDIFIIFMLIMEWLLGHEII